MLRLILTFFALTAINCTHAASFDCKKATTSHEKLICSSPLLDELDSKMGDAYRVTNGAFPIKGYVRDKQRQWGYEYRRCADVKSCSDILNKRISELAQLKNSTVYADYPGDAMQVTEVLIIIFDRDPSTKMVTFFGSWMPDGRMDPSKMKGYPNDGYICDVEIEFSRKGNLYLSNDVSLKISPSQLEMKGTISCGRGGIGAGIYYKK
jgi:uncharacterized protein